MRERVRITEDEPVVATAMSSSSQGYWGIATSDMDFCETNYEVSHYVAEFWNTLSSIPIVLVGLSGVMLCRAQSLGVEQTLCYGLIAVIGFV